MNQYIRYKEKLAKIKMLALDVDGVLTTGELIYNKNGEYLKQFNVKDGLGIKLLLQKGIVIAIITARKSEIVDYRMKELGIRFVYQGIEDKISLLDNLTSQFMIDWDSIAYIGDDLTDLPVLKKVGFAACPADAVDNVISECTYITKREGGKGAVREIADMILAAQNT